MWHVFIRSLANLVMVLKCAQAVTPRPAVHIWSILKKRTEPWDRVCYPDKCHGNYLRTMSTTRTTQLHSSADATPHTELLAFSRYVFRPKFVQIPSSLIRATWPAHLTLFDLIPLRICITCYVCLSEHASSDPFVAETNWSLLISIQH